MINRSLLLVQVIMFVVASAVVFGQTEDPFDGLPEFNSSSPPAPRTTFSFTNSSTANLFLEDIDRSSDVTRYSDLENGLFALSLYGDGLLDVDYAKILEALYLNFHYAGNVLDFDRGKEIAIETRATTDSTNSEIVEETAEEIPDVANEQSKASENLIDLTVGFGAIGLAATLDQDAEVTTDDTVETGVIGEVNPLTESSLPASTVFRDWAGPAGNLVTGHETTTDADGNVIFQQNRNAGVEDRASNLEPGIRAGTVLQFSEMTLRPFIGAGVNIRKDFETNEYTELSREPGAGFPDFQGASDVSEYWSRSRREDGSYTAIKPYVGASLQTEALSFALGYRLNLRIFDAQYTGTDGSDQTVSGTATSQEEVDFYTGTTYADGNYPDLSSFFDTTIYTLLVPSLGDTVERTFYGYLATERSFREHTVFPSIQYTTQTDNDLTFSTSLTPRITYRTQIWSQEGESVETATKEDASGDPSDDHIVERTTTYRGFEGERTEFEISPELKGALKYEIIPETLRFNAGVTATIARFLNRYQQTTNSGIVTEEVVERDGDGNQLNRTFDSSDLGDNYTETSDLETNVDEVGLTVDAGATWTMTENVRLDLQFATFGTTIIASRLAAQLVVQK